MGWFGLDEVERYWPSGKKGVKETREGIVGDRGGSGEVEDGG